MASSDDKLTADAQRAKTRSFAGYLKDRVTGSADFEKPSTKSASAAPAIGGKNPANAEALKEAGFKRGGAVKKPAATRSKPSTRW